MRPYRQTHPQLIECQRCSRVNHPLARFISAPKTASTKCHVRHISQQNGRQEGFIRIGIFGSRYSDFHCQAGVVLALQDLLLKSFAIPFFSVVTISPTFSACHCCLSCAMTCQNLTPIAMSLSPPNLPPSLPPSVYLYIFIYTYMCIFIFSNLSRNKDGDNDNFSINRFHRINE